MKDPDLEPLKVVAYAAAAWDRIASDGTFDHDAITQFEDLADDIAENLGDLDSTASVTWVAGMLACLAIIDQCDDQDPLGKSLEVSRAMACAMIGQDTIIAVYGPVATAQLAVGCLASRLIAGKLA